MKPFGQLSRGEKLKLLTAWVDGEGIEYKSDSSENWVLCIIDPLWNANHSYRIAPKKIELPWHLILPQYKWAAMDEDGSWYAFMGKPEVDADYLDKWVNKTLNYAQLILIIDHQGLDWKDTLTKRPA